MERAVKAVSVASKSNFDSRARFDSASATAKYGSPNNSRHVLFGGGATKNGCFSHPVTSGSHI